MRRADVLNSLPVGPGAFVVEIGAGPTPFRYTKLILDKYPFENIERHGDIVNMAPVIKADAVKLPLADQSCDLLFASHVLEHIGQPELFLQEGKRCSKWIYLEFPTRVRELIYAWSFHRWLIEVEGQTLVFYRNDVPQMMGDFFHRNYDFLFDVLSEARFEELNHSLCIETDRLAYRFSPQTAFEHALQVSARGEQKVDRGPYGSSGVGNLSYPRSLLIKTLLWSLTPDWLVKWRRRMQDRVNARRKPELTEAILTKMVCQKCRANDLTFADARSAIVCRSCQVRYPQVRGVFDFDF